MSIETDIEVLGVGGREGGAWRGWIWGHGSIVVLTSFAATLFDPFGVCDVIVTSLAVEKCSDGETAQIF